MTLSGVSAEGLPGFRVLSSAFRAIAQGFRWRLGFGDACQLRLGAERFFSGSAVS